MTFTLDEALQDACEQHQGREIDLGCTLCGESWAVHVFEDECLTEDQTKCPTRGCQGEGLEL